MNKTVIFIFVFIPFVFLSCSDEYKVSKAIKNWERSKNGYKVSSLIILEEPAAYFYQDSCKVWEQNLETFVQNKNIELQRGLDSINKRIEKTETKINDTDNALMKRAINNKLFELNKEKENHLQIIEIYKTEPERTQIGVIQEQILYYRFTPEKLIGYVYLVQNNGSNFDGIKESKNSKYLLSRNLQKVLAEF